MPDSLGYGDCLDIVDRAVDRYKNVMLFRRPDDSSWTMAEIVHRVLAADRPGIAAQVGIDDLVAIDREASGHSDYRHEMALRISRLVRRYSQGHLNPSAEER